MFRGLFPLTFTPSLFFLFSYSLSNIHISIAIADQLYRNPSLHPVLRERAVKELIERSHFYSQWIPQTLHYDVYVTKMR